MKTRFPFLKLRTKFIAAIFVVVAVFGLLNIYVNKQGSNKILQKEIEKRALLIAQIHAVFIPRLILFEDKISLQRFINEIKKSENDIAYIFVLDSQKQVIADTFDSNFPEELLGANLIQLGQSFSWQMIVDEHNNLYRDLNYPILEGKLGYLRLGIRNNVFIQVTQKIEILLTAMVLSFLIIGIASAIIFARWITRPISMIIRAFGTIDLKEEFKSVKIKTKDEFNILADKFNEMAIRLQSTHSKLLKTQQSLAKSDKLATVGVLAAGLAHEINNPLAGIKNCIIRIEKKYGQDNYIDYFSLMMTAIQNIEKIVGELLNYSRQDDYHFKFFDLHESILKAINLVEYNIKKNDITIEKKFDERIKSFYGDSLHLEQVFINLLMNSVDAMPQGGNISVFSILQNSSIYLILKDSGEGIPPDCIDKIFDPFFTTKDSGKGTGLGLSVSYNIIQIHGGNITVESEVNRGTKFSIVLPYPTAELTE